MISQKTRPRPMQRSIFKKDLLLHHRVSSMNAWFGTWLVRQNVCTCCTAITFLEKFVFGGGFCSVSTFVLLLILVLPAIIQLNPSSRSRPSLHHYYQFFLPASRQFFGFQPVRWWRCTLGTSGSGRTRSGRPRSPSSCVAKTRQQLHYFIFL